MYKRQYWNGFLRFSKNKTRKPPLCSMFPQYNISTNMYLLEQPVILKWYLKIFQEKPSSFVSHADR